MRDKHQMTEEPHKVKVSCPVLKTNGVGDNLVEFNRSNKRWQGTHDCKGYLDKYQSLHYQHGLSCAVNIVFWWNVPAVARARQQMELELIERWRSPFNKENWTLWGAPFF